MSTKTQVQWRRAKILELSSQGYSQVEMATRLRVDEPTISRDVAILRRQAKENIHNFIDKELPHEYHKTLVGLTVILKEAWTAAQNATGRDKMQALELAQKAYQMRLELLTNSTVVESAVRFVDGRKKAHLDNMQKIDERIEEMEEEKTTNGIF